MRFAIAPTSWRSVVRALNIALMVNMKLEMKTWAVSARNAPVVSIGASVPRWPLSATITCNSTLFPWICGARSSLGCVTGGFEYVSVNHTGAFCVRSW